MRFWYFSSSVNSFINVHAQPSSGARCLIFGRILGLLSYFMCANSECSGKTERRVRATGRNCRQMRRKNIFGTKKFHLAKTSGEK